MQIKLKKVIISLLIATITISATGSSFSAKGNDAAAPAAAAITSATAESGYRKYINAQNGLKAASNNIILSGADYATESTASLKKEQIYENETNVLLWENGKGTVTWKLTVPDDGFYNLGITFLPLKNGPDIEYGIKINGSAPFEGAEALKLTRDWVNATEAPRTDKNGNQIAAEQVESGKFVFRKATDPTGVEISPYEFALKKGENTLSLTGNGYAMAISKIGFYAPESLQAYSEVSKNYDLDKTNVSEDIVIQAENAILKSDNSLIPKALNGNAGMQPVDPFVTKINCIGGSTWAVPGQELTWEFEVKEDGYYQFGARYKQSEVVNGESLRHLKIDGKTPFAEAGKLAFNYGTDWQYYALGEENPQYIWLTKGKHTVSLAVTLGQMSDYYYRLNNIVTNLGDLYLKIVMITGEVPDVNRDYELFKQIPGFNEVLTEAKEELKKIIADIKSLGSKQGSQYTAAMNNSVRVIDQMLEAPYIAHIYVKDFYSTYTTLSSWLNEMKEMPLTLDEIRFAPVGKDFGWEEPDFFAKLWFGVERLLGSYLKGYSTGKAQNSDKSIKLWINWGRDQTMVLDSLIRESFTAETGIEVELQIVSNSLINGLLANNFPDVQLHLERTAPVNYGMRGALLDLTTFEDCEEVLGRFMPGADTPYWREGALYALPDQQTFFCMFYRTDIFEQLGLTVPKTWDEFLDCATVIQRYNMSVCVPYTQIASATTVNVGIGNLNLYPTLMMQSGLSLYNKELNATALNSVKGINVFKGWTEMYSDYGYLKEADFYNRFRNGSMPMGIASYTTYMTLYSTAPEIKGRWTMTNVPGTVGGTDVIAGGGTGCSIVKRSANPEAAWEFLKWWTSAEVQARYSNNVESILGPLGRVSTANVEAFKNMAWNPEDMQLILNQWEKVREVPEVPGSYYLARAIDQAYWSVINDNINSKDAVTKWAKVADEEISRKIKEYE